MSEQVPISGLPLSAYPNCLACGTRIDNPDSRLVLREVVGYTRHRSQGGANHIVARRETGRIVCADCALVFQRTGAFEQQGLF